MNKFKELLNSNKIIIFDGAMGSMIQKSNVQVGRYPEMLNFTNSDLILNIHKDYLKAGANVISTNSFGANSVKSKGCEKSSDELVTKAVQLAKQAVNEVGTGLVALDIGPTGHLLFPMGDLTFEDAYNSFANMAITGEKSGADLVIIETMSDIKELKTAVLAVKENTSLPIVASATYSDSLRMLSGTDVKTVVAMLEGLGVDVVGFNCGVGLEVAQKITNQYLKYSSTAILSQPNAGMPIVGQDGTVSYPATASEFAIAQNSFAKNGVAVLGGCCGTTPDHIKEVAIVTSQSEKVKLEQKTQKVITSFNKSYNLNSKDVTIGYELDCTKDSELLEQLIQGDIDSVMDSVFEINDDYDVLSLNLNNSQIKKENILLLIREIQSVCSNPLIFNISNSEILKEVLRQYNGKCGVVIENPNEQIIKMINYYGGELL